MQFYIPAVEDEIQAETIYDSIIQYAEEQTDFTVTRRRIFSISYCHDGTDHYAEVGKIHERIGELVFAILESVTLANQYVYLVCSTNHAVLRGSPILVAQNVVSEIQDFDRALDKIESLKI